MAPSVGPLRARILVRERNGVESAGGKIAVLPGRAGKMGGQLRIAFAGGEGIAEADHEPVFRRDRHARLRAVHCPRDGRLAGDRLGVVRIGGDDDAKFAAIARDGRRACVERPLGRRDKRGGGARGDRAGKGPLARLARGRVGVENAHDPSRRAHIVAPEGAAIVQPLDRIPAGGGRSGQRRAFRPLADDEARPAAPVEFRLQRRRPPSLLGAQLLYKVIGRGGGVARPGHGPVFREVAGIAEFRGPEGRPVDEVLKLLRGRSRAAVLGGVKVARHPLRGDVGGIEEVAEIALDLPVEGKRSSRRQEPEDETGQKESTGGHGRPPLCRRSGRAFYARPSGRQQPRPTLVASSWRCCARDHTARPLEASRSVARRRMTSMIATAAFRTMSVAG